MPNWWPATTAQEQPTGTRDVYTLDRLRWFQNWADMGIAYAYPDMGGANFWGVVNHDDEEGLIRVADNEVTGGLKLWTWGYDSVNVDPFAQPPDERLTYIEMWAGDTPEFLQADALCAQQRDCKRGNLHPDGGADQRHPSQPGHSGELLRQQRGRSRAAGFRCAAGAAASRAHHGGRRADRRAPDHAGRGGGERDHGRDSGGRGEPRLTLVDAGGADVLTGALVRGS